MSEWWTYTVSDFLLFSPRTYYRLLELYNLAIWPVQLAGVALGLAIIILLLAKRGRNDAIIAGLLALCWLWTAWAFHYQRYAQINWAAPWFAAAFAFQALLLLVFGVVAGRAVPVPVEGGNRWIATSLLGVAVLAYPLLAPLAGRPWTTAETFGVTSDPTAIGTAVALARVRGRIRWLLLVVPLLWCAIATGTLWAMDAPEAFVVAGAAALALWLAVRAERSSGSDTSR